MVQQFLSGFEREDAYNTGACFECTQPITNPICHTCLGDGVIKWLTYYPNIKKKLMPKLKKYIREVNNSAIDGVTCVACKKRKAALCPYCFSSGILNLLKRNKIDKLIIGDFLTIFNYDQEHEGYIGQAIEDGLY